MKITSIWDAGDEYADRYTIVTDEPSGPIPLWSGRGHQGNWEGFMALCVSDNPNSPNMGVSQWSAAKVTPCLGKEITLDDLPVNVQAHVLRRIYYEEEE